MATILIGCVCVCVCEATSNQKAQGSCLTFGITNRSHCVTFVSVTLFSYIELHSRASSPPSLCSSLHSSSCSLCPCLLLLTFTVVLGLTLQIMTQATDSKGDQPTRTMYWSGQDVDTTLIHQLWWMTRWTVVVCEFCHVKLHSSAPFEETQDIVYLCVYFVYLPCS